MRRKKFNYKPRFQEDSEMRSKNALESEWDNVRSTSKRKGNILTSLPFLVLFLILVLVLFYILNRY